jgi:hypothetical protein
MMRDLILSLEDSGAGISTIAQAGKDTSCLYPLRKRKK